jgi:hypothetical protein
MGEVPDVIYAGADQEDGWRWPMASKYPVQHPTPVHAFVRAEALPDRIDLYRVLRPAIVEALRAADIFNPADEDLQCKAADEIERLTRLVSVGMVMCEDCAGPAYDAQDGWAQCKDCMSDKEGGKDG